jgi:hypothetical protein
MAFFKEKDTIRKISTLSSGPAKDREMKTIYSINKIMGADMYYNVFVDGILVEEQKKALVADFDDIKKYEKVDVAFKVRTIYVDALTNEVKETFKYNCSQEAEADLKHKNFEFNAVSINGTVKLTKSDIIKEVKK